MGIKRGVKTLKGMARISRKNSTFSRVKPAKKVQNRSYKIKPKRVSFKELSRIKENLENQKSSKDLRRIASLKGIEQNAAVPKKKPESKAASNNEMEIVMMPGESGNLGIPVTIPKKEPESKAVLSDEVEIVMMPGEGGKLGIPVAVPKKKPESTTTEKNLSAFHHKEEASSDAKNLNKLFHQNVPESQITKELRKEIESTKVPVSEDAFSWERTTYEDIKRELLARLKFTLGSNQNENNEVIKNTIKKKIESFRKEAPSHNAWSRGVVAEVFEDLKQDPEYRNIIPEGLFLEGE